MPFDLSDAFRHKQEQLAIHLRGTAFVNHPTDQGDIGEDNWSSLLRELLPTRYGVSKATVVDSRNGISEAQDIVIHDRHYSPLVFNQSDVIYLPAESVYAVFEVKPELDKTNMEYASKKAASVRILHRTSAPIPHAGGVINVPKPPPIILAGLLTARPAWKEPLGKSFRKHLTLAGEGRLDLGCISSAGAWEVSDDSGDSVVTVGANKGLIFFVMRLLARLQTMATVPAMDYDAWGAVLTSDS